MFRAITSAIITSAALLAVSGANAQTSGGYYLATPVSAPTKTSLVTRSTPWHLTNGVFVASQAPERDMVLCQLVAKDVGQLSGFSVGGKAYDSASLDKCNAKAGGAKVTIAKNDSAPASGN